MVGFTVDEHNSSLVTSDMISAVEAAKAGIVDGSISVADWSQE